MFFLAVDPAKRGPECPCKTDELQVVERDGHRWSAARKSELCAHCDLARMGILPPCPVHLIAGAGGGFALTGGPPMVGARRPGP